MKRATCSPILKSLSRPATELKKRIATVSAVAVNRVRNAEGAELIEFALALPMILVMALGLLDFANAYSVKQRIANAAREGARFASTNNKDVTNSNPPTVPETKDDVVTYLQNAGVNTSFIGNTMTYDTGTYVATYYSSGNYGLEIERAVNITDSTSSVTIPSVRVTLRYPYNWTMGFNKIIQLLVPGASYASTLTIEADATMSY